MKQNNKLTSTATRNHDMKSNIQFLWQLIKKINNDIFTLLFIQTGKHTSIL